MHISQKRLSLLLVTTILWSFCSVANAKPTQLFQLAATRDQAALAVGREAKKLSVAVCREGRCDWKKAFHLAVPDWLAASATPAHFSALNLGMGRSAVSLRLPVQDGQPWAVVALAPLGAQAGPVVVFDDWLGMRVDELGELRGAQLQITQSDEGVSTVIVGRERGEISLCGRPTLLSPRALVPSDLRLHRIKLQRLSEQERARATPLSVVTAAETGGNSVLTVVAASSSKGAPQVLVDGDPHTAWSEKRGGTGRGEFIILRAPSSVALAAFELTLSAPIALPLAIVSAPPVAPASVPPLASASVAQPEASLSPSAAAVSPQTIVGTVAPKSFWIATDDALYSVTLPAPSAAGLSSFRLKLPEPVHTSCVSLVLESAQPWPALPPKATDLEGEGASEQSSASPAKAQAGPAASPKFGKVDVSIAEFSAVIELDDAKLQAAMNDLGAGGEKAENAEALLSAVPSQSVTLLRRRYPAYSVAGKARVLNILDTVSCTSAARGLVVAMEAEPSAETERAQARLLACGSVVSKALARETKSAEGRRLRQLAEVLAKVAPLRAVRVLLKQARAKDPTRRAALRHGLRLALQSPSFDLRNPKQRAALSKLKRRPMIELLRSLAERVVEFRDVITPYVDTLLSNDPSYRTRYLLLEPLAYLAPHVPSLAKRLSFALTADKKAPVRARAARLMPAVGSLKTSLLKATQDKHVRVREAAVLNIGEHRVKDAEGALVELLAHDDWPLVRAASVRALRAINPERAGQAALAQAAATDSSPTVRRPAIVALAQLDARRYISKIRDRLNDDEEDMHVRAAAASALGQLCDMQSVEALTAYAKPLRKMGGSESQNVVGRAALASLGRLAPPDLKARLSAFEGRQVPAWSKRVAKAAASHPERCAPQPRVR